LPRGGEWGGRPSAAPPPMSRAPGRQTAQPASPVGQIAKVSLDLGPFADQSLAEVGIGILQQCNRSQPACRLPAMPRPFARTVAPPRHQLHIPPSVTDLMQLVGVIVTVRDD